MHVTCAWPGLLQATLVSNAIGPRLEAREACAVHSIFRSALNLETRSGLVTIAGPSIGLLPHGLRIGTEIDFLSLGLRPGQVVFLEQHRIRIADTTIEIDLSGAVPWSARIPGVNHRLGQARWRDRAGGLRRVAVAAVRARPGAMNGLGPLLDRDGSNSLGAVARIAAPRLERLVEAVHADDAAAAGLAAESLVGLGPGLTPSGDDALVGMAAAITAMAGPRALDARFLDRVVLATPARTTTVSATFLRHAAAGEFSAGLHQLMRALIGPDASEASTTIERCVAYGATSGADTLIGVLMGLDALVTAVPRRFVVPVWDRATSAA